MNKLWKKCPDEIPENGSRVFSLHQIGARRFIFESHYNNNRFGMRYSEYVSYWCYESDLIASITQPEADRATQPAEARNIKLIKALEKIKETEPAEKPGFFRYKIPNRADCAVIAEEALKNSN